VGLIGTDFRQLIFLAGELKQKGRICCGKSFLKRHSERSEESLFDLNPGKERFLGTQRALE